ncbi:MAG: thioredoxin family protein [bacterium]
MMDSSPLIRNINLDDFTEAVLKPSHEKPVLLDFWADWCSPCRFIAPVLTQIVEHYNGRVLLTKLEADEGENMKLAGQYQVRGFPTIILFENAQEVARFSSARSFNFVEEFIEQNSRLLVD